MLTFEDLKNLTLRQLLTAMGQELEEAGIEDGLREAQYLLTSTLDLDQLEFLRQEQNKVSDEKSTELWDFFNRRKAREPLAYLIEEREFFGRSFKVGTGALIPRPETEHLIEWVLEENLHKKYKSGIDLCAGPGTIGMTLALELECPFSLVELSDEAMRWAEQNKLSFGLESQIELIEGDVTEPLKLEKVDLLVSNPPYIPSADMKSLQEEVRDFEPHLALDGGGDGLDMMKRMMANAVSLAQPNCHFYIELGLGHEDLLRSCDFGPWQCDGWRHDLARIPRIVRYTFKP